MAKKTLTLVGFIDRLSNSLEVAREEATSFETDGINAAGLRTRKALQEIRVNAQEARKLVTDIKNERKKLKKTGKKKTKK